MSSSSVVLYLNPFYSDNYFNLVVTVGVPLCYRVTFHIIIVCFPVQVCLTSQRPILRFSSQSEPSVIWKLGPAEPSVWKSAQQLLWLWTAATNWRWGDSLCCHFLLFFLLHLQMSFCFLALSWLSSSRAQVESIFLQPQYRTSIYLFIWHLRTKFYITVTAHRQTHRCVCYWFITLWNEICFSICEFSCFGSVSHNVLATIIHRSIFLLL